ncbi:MAG TPA: polyphosphate kinase 2 family protein, partial [Anaerolineales bacterium]|nr:polyphosphate kinase 2 family protein [Anaerolineales bacterium]
LKRYIVDPGAKVRLSDWDPNDQGEYKGNKQQALAEIETLNRRLGELHEVLFAEHQHKILVILQAMDTGGKDGVIRHVFNGVNPQGARVANFKEPTAEELDHDYLWRVHKQVPAKGELVIFNRSHYEDVLIVRVHGLVPPDVWRKRFDQINAFEQMLVENGTTILKFYLHIDQAEQKERLQARLDDPHKHWKFRRGDLQERKRWSEYMQAYEDVLNKTSRAAVPWYIIPANHKWYRNLVISSILVDTLEGLKMKFPEPEENLDGIVID